MGLQYSQIASGTSQVPAAAGRAPVQQAALGAPVQQGSLSAAVPSGSLSAHEQRELDSLMQQNFEILNTQQQTSGQPQIPQVLKCAPYQLMGLF